jgi:polysaccharide deacetylase 2 family uncharacterized protein YibQ
MIGRRLLVVGVTGGALLLGLLAAGVLGWSRTQPGQATLLRFGSRQMFPQVQEAVEAALASVFPDLWRGPAAGPGAPPCAYDWPRADRSYAGAIRCRCVVAPPELTYWEVAERIASALEPIGARVLWSERCPLPARRGAESNPNDERDELMRVDVGVTGCPTHTLIVHRTTVSDVPVRWGVDLAESAWDLLAAAPNQPTIALVIDDWGYFHNDVAEQFLELPFPLTLSILPGLPYSRRYALAATELALPPEKSVPAVADPGRSPSARALRQVLGCRVELSVGKSAPALMRDRREILLHLPMEPEGYPEVDPGPKAVMTGMTEETIAALVDASLASLPGVSGVNNHMGSRATADRATMRLLMQVLAHRELLFLDSLTTPHSVAYDEARRAGLASLRSRLFLDEAHPDAATVRANLHKLERAARAGGFAIGIGHPHPETLEALRSELPRLRAAGVRLVTVSELYALQTERTRRAAS